MKSKEKFLARFDEGLHICVGLDTDIKKIPKHLLNSNDPILEFNKQIIDATKVLAAAYKINLAFYEVYGYKGLETLEKTIDYVPGNIPIIGDAKRGDIGNTAKMYAQSLYDYYKFDSVTLHPYMGYDSVQPFIDYLDKISFILALTSNESSSDFEKLKLASEKYLFQNVIEKIKNWNNNSNCGVVFGATNPVELKENISSLDELFVLLPGVGSQGGSIKDVVPIFKSAGHSKFLINVSRALIYSDNSNQFAKVANDKILDYNREIAKLIQ